METTKTGKLQRIVMPKDIVDILKWHVDQLPKGPMGESELLFPSETGGYRAASCLDRPFEEVTTKLKLNKRVNPRAMRRTFQDLARAPGGGGMVRRPAPGPS